MGENDSRMLLEYIEYISMRVALSLCQVHMWAFGKSLIRSSLEGLAKILTVKLTENVQLYLYKFTSVLGLRNISQEIDC